MVVAEEDMFYAELEILRQLLPDRRAKSRVIKVIWLKAREDDFVFVPVPNESAQHGMRRAQLLEEIKRERYILRGAQHRVPKSETQQALAVLALRDGRAVSVWPGWRIRFGEL